MSKAFDVVVSSKYLPDGTNQMVDGLKKADQAAVVLQSTFERLQVAGANLARSGQGISSLGQILGSDALRGLGQTVANVGQLAYSFENLAKTMNTIAAIKMVGPLAIILGAGAIGNAAGGAVEDALGLSSTQDKVTAVQKLQDALNRLPADEQAKKMDQFKAAVEGLTPGTKQYTATVNAFADSLNKLTAGGPLLPQLGKMFDGVNAGLDKAVKLAGQLQDKLRQQASNSFQSLVGGGEDLTNNLAAIQQKITDAQADQAKARKTMLIDIAISEARRLEDVARQNQRTLISIDAQRVDAIATADATLASTLAQIAQDSADQRAQIERSYQDQIRQIQQSSGEGIEDAIERRDARALSKALNSRSQQLADAQRNRDQQLADQARAEEKSKAQAQAAHDQAVEQAKAAAQAAVEVMREQNAQAADDARLAQQRQKQDFDLANGRRLQDMAAQGRKEADQALANFKAIQSSYANFINNLATQTRNAGTTTSPLMVAIKDYVMDLIGELSGDGRTYYKGGA